MTTALLITSLSTFVNIYVYLMIIRILLTWFPNIDWMQQIAGFLSTITDPYLDLFRSVIPPIGGMDLSPILAIFLLQFIAGALTTTVSGLSF